MLFSNVTINDIGPLRTIHDSSRFPFPDFTRNISTRSVIDNGRLIGAGLLRATSEGIIVMDEKAPVTTKVRAIKGLISSLVPEAKYCGIDDCHVFVKDDKMYDLLKKLGFQDCIGKVMVLHF